MKKLIPATCFLLITLIGRNANAIDLLDVFQQAQLNDAGYAAAKAQYQAQQERLPQARAGLLERNVVRNHTHDVARCTDGLDEVRRKTHLVCQHTRRRIQPPPGRKVNHPFILRS